MYFYIMAFQIVCILVSGICLYLAASGEEFRREKCGMPVLSVLCGIFLMEMGYGFYLQATAMAGLQTAEKVCLLGKLVTAVGLFVTCVSLSDKDSGIAKASAGILGLTAAVFFFFDNFFRFLYIRQEFLQNQYFYYIETELTEMGEIFYLALRCAPLLGALWFIFWKKEKMPAEKWFLAAVLFWWTVSALCRDRAFLRHYDADMPVGAALSVCMVIFVAWKTKRVYTE